MGKFQIYLYNSSSFFASSLSSGFPHTSFYPSFPEDVKNEIFDKFRISLELGKKSNNKPFILALKSEFDRKS